MTENEEKAIKWMKNVRDDAVVTLDHIRKNEPNVSPMLYEGRKQKAETIIVAFEELEAYRVIQKMIGIPLEDFAKLCVEKVPEECKNPQKAIILTDEDVDKWERYKTIGTVEEFKALKDKPKCEDCAGCTIWKCDCANIRDKAIDDFVKRLKKESYRGYVTLEDYFEDTIESVAVDDICRIAEEMRGEP